MGRKLRVFISSTMKDLRNERIAVVERLNAFNFEPVNAEGWNPNGNQSWSRIQSEIESSDIFILILGSSYGWIPENGPKGGLGLSVTHLELEHARTLDIPVLPFLKRLDYDTDSTSEDAKKRDAFRREVRDWSGGYFTTEFDLANDLASKVGQSLIELLMDEFQKLRVRNRSTLATQSAIALTRELPIPETPRLDSLPAKLVNAVRSRQVVLFAGSGISLAAGLPSASAIAQSLLGLVHESDPKYAVNPTGSAFAGIATDLAVSRGHQYLADAINKILDSPQGVEPTIAHLKSVELFDHIITTNYDVLFELAALRLHLDLSVVAEEMENPLPDKTVIKLHGSVSAPDSLLLTERDVFMFDLTRRRLWSAVLAELRTKMVIVIGASLRDPSIIRLFSEAGESVHGYFVVPDLFVSTPERVGIWNLQCIQTDADTFMKKLSEAVSC